MVILQDVLVGIERASAEYIPQKKEDGCFRIEETSLVSFYMFNVDRR